MAWGNEGDQQRLQNMIGPAGFILHVAQGLVNGWAGVGNNVNITSDDNGGRIEAGFDFNNLPLQTVLRLNTNLDNGDVIISHPDRPDHPQASVIVQSPRLQIGSQAEGIQPEQPGHIDANGIPLIGQPLRIGTRDTTNFIEFGQAGQQISLFASTFKIGAQSTDFQGQMRMFNFAIIMNAAPNINDANAHGLRFMDPGPEGIPAIAFVHSGQVRGWSDFNGFHNPPPPPAP